jgi:hypothetical protein
MEVWDFQKVFSPLGKPLSASRSLALGTMSVGTVVVNDDLLMAQVAPVLVSTQSLGSTLRQVLKRPFFL